jgi:putative flippase GtrA
MNEKTKGELYVLVSMGYLIAFATVGGTYVFHSIFGMWFILSMVCSLVIALALVTVYNTGLEYILKDQYTFKKKRKKK